MRGAALGICCVTFAVLVAGAKAAIVLTEHTDVDGTRYVYRVTEDVIRETPSWDGISQDPPLSISDAVRSALVFVKQNHADCGILSLEHISLGRVYDSQITNHWYYCISIVGRKAEDRYWRKSFTVVLLMNGKVVSPVMFRAQGESDEESARGQQ